MDSFCSKHIMFQLENFRAIYVMTQKGVANTLQWKLTYDLKNDIRNLVNFHANSRKSEYLYFDRKKYRRIMPQNTEEWCTVWRKADSWLGSKNGMRNLVSFNASSGRSENLHFDVLLLSIAYKVSAKKVQKNDLSWH